MGEHSSTVGGSSAGALIKCPGRYQLSKKAPPKGSSSFADEGSMLHSAMEYILLNDVTDLSVMVGFIDDNYPGHTLTQALIDEMVVPALDCLDMVAKRYGTFEFEVEARVQYPTIDDAFGTCDIIGFNDDYTFIIDWKFGRGVHVSAEKNVQLMFYTYAATHTLSEMFSGKPIIQAIIQPAMSEQLSIYETDENEVLEVANEIDNAWKVAQTDNPPMATGDHCRFCPAITICPEQRKGVDLGLTNVKGEIKLPELPDLIGLCDQIEPWIKAVRKAAHEALERGEKVPGYKLVPKRAIRHWVDEEKAAKKMDKKVGDIYVKKLISPAVAEKMYKKAGVDFSTIAKEIVAISSGNTMAPESDKRPDAITTGRQGTDLGLPSK